MRTLYYFIIAVLVIFSYSIYAQWVQQTLPGDIDVALGIDFIDQNNGIMGGWHATVMLEINGNAYYTTNGGTNWIQASFPDSMRGIVSLQMINGNVAYGAGAYNFISTDESTISINNNLTLNSEKNDHYAILGMDFSKQQDYRGYFVETTDGGLSWHPKGSFEDSVFYLIDLNFLDLQTGFVLATGPANNTFAAILKTTDSGNNWDYVYHFESFLFLNEIKFFDQLNGIAVGAFDDATNSYGVVLKTTNGGDNWIRTALPQLFWLGGVTYLSSNSVLISGIKTDGSAVIFRSDDGGNIWFECCTYTNLHLINGINSFPSSGIIVVYGQYQPTGSAIPFVEATIDNGLTWYYDLLSQFPDYYFTKSKLVDENRWYITGTQSAQMGFVLFTDNSGGIPVELILFTAEVDSNKVQLQWQTATELNNLGFEIERKSDNTEWGTICFVEGKGTTLEVQEYSFVDNTLMSEGKYYYRLKQIDYDGTFTFSEIINIYYQSLSVEFSLLQNYPNPFNPTTNIQFTISDFGFTSLKVYDVLGNEIATLVNEELPAGEYEVEFNSVGISRDWSLPSRIYFYQLKTGDIIETKKMVLIK
jgi:photosystem II stability/assembly factor-like uncharacterized protein